MYLAHFGLHRRPFDVSTEPATVFVDGSRAAFTEALRFVLERERGFVKITGAVGAGKTTLCRWLLRTLPTEHFKAIHLADPTLSAQQLDFALAEALGAESVRDDPDRTRASVEARLRACTEGGRQMIVLVDEAHAMPLETLERLRLLGQGVGSGDNLLRLVFLGPPELDQRLAGPDYAALRDRIVHSLRLRRLNLDDVRDYLHQRLKAAGYEGPRVFSANAVRLIAGLSRGLPRRINLLADKGMMAAAVEHRFEVRSREIATAAKEIKLERARAEKASSRQITVAAGLGFAGGIVATLAFVLAALHFGWVEVHDHAITSAPADTPSSEQSAAPVSHFSR